MRYPGAIFVPGCISFSVGRSGFPIKGFVIHSAVGNGRPARFFPPLNQASTHFWIAKDGRVEQYVDTNNTAWANGELNRFGGPDPAVPWLREYYRDINGVGGPNYVTISTELEGGINPYNEPLTEIQYQSLRRLTDWVLKEHHLGPPQRHINLIEHNQISATACPSDRVPHLRLITDLSEPSIEEEDMKGFFVKTREAPYVYYVNQLGELLYMTSVEAIDRLVEAGAQPGVRTISENTLNSFLRIK